MKLPLSLIILIPVLPAMASEIQIRGDKGTNYAIRCENEIGLKVEFGGTAPSMHHIAESRNPSSCEVTKLSEGGRLKVEFDLSGSSAGSNIFAQHEIIMEKPFQTQKVRFVYSSKPNLSAEPPSQFSVETKSGKNPFPEPYKDENGRYRLPSEGGESSTYSLTFPNK